MPPFPAEVRSILNRVMGSSPADLRLVAQRLHDHALEERMSGEELRSALELLGYRTVVEFCAELGMPAHVAERWERFGVSIEMKQVFAYLMSQRKRFAEAVEEFEAITHVGLKDFLRSRGIV
ncbi:hypothetical protein SAMN04515648_3423 [Phyllobacterium sp. CL33Tsu]|uniref:hypothetical protein n=1 Tax=Phyllobacterium sp. CL33Tsu TaxID=1798191 RepID=UPI0008F21DB8|nr:hypothetical protein [Phyllobacterium sp. CL33Tsu]SFJ28503.1 hypothetical protein SAMN04515648_3423 [Phyllobacterium sp. CL33Tsu]